MGIEHGSGRRVHLVQINLLPGIATNRNSTLREIHVKEPGLYLLVKAHPKVTQNSITL